MPFEPATNETKSKIIFSPNTTVSELIPTISPFRPLWNPHTSSAGGVSMSENKQLFYRHLYFSGFSEKDLEAEFKRNTFEVISTLQNFTGLKVPREESISSYAVEPRPCYLSEDVQDYKR